MNRLASLALETSGRIGSVALAADGVVLAEEQFPHGLQHAARILSVADSLCRASGLKPTDLAELYVSAGPGSFTGLRIGITMAKTLALASGIKLVAVPTARVLAENAAMLVGAAGGTAARNLVIVLDAKRGQIFTARFEREGSRWIEREPARLDTLAAMVARSPRPVHLLGEGLPYHEKFLDAADPSIIKTEPDCWRGRAGAVAALGWAMARRGEFTDAAAPAPIYVRPPEAEEKMAAGRP